MNGIFIKYRTSYAVGVLLASEIFVSRSTPNEIYVHTDQNSAENPMKIAQYKNESRAYHILEEICACINRGQSYYEMPEE